MDAIRVAVLGASGFSGAELLRLVAAHPKLTVAAVGADENAGRPLTAVHPHLESLGDLTLERLDAEVAGRADAAFLALPHGRSAAVAPSLVEAGLRVVDLSGDFRLPAEAYPEWYGFTHPTPAWLGKAAYGLPELFRTEIEGADLVANPGCYPTAALLALVPPLRAGLLRGGPIVVDAKSGVSGAGAAPTDTVHHARTEGSIRPYRVGRHQHTPEIEQALERVGGTPVSITLVPHLVPAVRGVLVTGYAAVADGVESSDLSAVLAEAYADTPFVRALPPGHLPDPKRVTGANVCEVGAAIDRRTGTAILVGAVDNLVKGAAGQAVQNLNLMFGLGEATGLPVVGLYP